jgi:3-deoxy-D-manno-octulosonic-acid transferase
LYFIYSTLAYLLVPWIIVRLIYRGLRNPAYLKRWRERFGYVSSPETSEVIWIHAVSVGEVRATVPIVKILLEENCQAIIYITTMTPTGSDQVQQLFGDSVRHSYVPYDLPGPINRFLSRVKPKLAIIMETELWPNIFRLSDERGIPIVVTNVRLSAASAKRYQKVQHLTRATLARVSCFAVQSQSDAERLIILGAPQDRVHVTGSIKFELNLPASLHEAAEVLRGEWGRGRPVWLAASTHEGEEELVLRACRQLKHRFPDHLCVIVPRHPERFNQVVRLCRRADFKVAQRSEQQGPLADDTEILVGDTMGELQLFYAAVDAAFVAGSLVPVGGHNLLEASAVGTPVVVGPHITNFLEITQMAVERGAAVQIHRPEQLAPAISDLIGNANRRFGVGEAGKKLVDENRGALVQNIDLLKPYSKKIGCRD